MEDFSSYGVTTTAEDVGLFQRHSRQVVVVDDFYQDPVQVRELALKQNFAPDLASHKGQRTKEKFLFPYQKEEFERLLGGVRIKNWLNHRYNGVFQFCTRTDKLVFHADSQAYAGVVYLTPNAPIGAGTSFFRSKATGLRKAPTPADCARMSLSGGELIKRTFQGKLLDPTAWDLVDRTANVFNRLVIWDAQLIHAATEYFGTTLQDSRLFHLFFFDVHEEETRNGGE